MSDPRRRIPLGEFPHGNQEVQSFPLTIPPPPLPPLFPTLNIPPIPPSSFASRFSSSNESLHPISTTFHTPHFPNIPSPIPSQTFRNSPIPQWSTSQTPDMCWSNKSAPQDVWRNNFPLTKDMCRPNETTSQNVIRPIEYPRIINEKLSKQEKWKYFEESSKSDIQREINNWLENTISRREIKKSTKNEIKIYRMKDKFNQAFRLIRELENAARTLTVMVKTVTPPEWHRKCKEIEEKKDELRNAITNLKLNEEEVNILKAKCLKRSKKRARLRRQSERRKKQKEEETVKEQNINIQIENWQREMQEEVERVQREEDLQKQADAVLWGVTQEKTEAKRQVALLSGLLELRQVRVKRLTAAGKPVSQLQIHTFDTVIERLKKMWIKLLDKCKLEEQALRGMLIEADIKADPVKTYKKLVLQEWETALFGAVGTLDFAPQEEQLVDIRRDWDQFAVQGRSVISSTVPPGWVLPVAPSSDQWHSLLKY